MTSQTQGTSAFLIIWPHSGEGSFWGIGFRTKSLQLAASVGTSPLQASASARDPKKMKITSIAMTKIKGLVLSIVISLSFSLPSLSPLSLPFCVIGWVLLQELLACLYREECGHLWSHVLAWLCFIRIAVFLLIEEEGGRRQVCNNCEKLWLETVVEDRYPSKVYCTRWINLSRSWRCWCWRRNSRSCSSTFQAHQEVEWLQRSLHDL